MKDINPDIQKHKALLVLVALRGTPTTDDFRLALARVLGIGLEDVEEMVHLVEEAEDRML